jgi:hypothetical protein
LTKPKRRIPVLDFLKLVRWLDGRPVLDYVEPYRRQILTDVLDQHLPDGRVRYNLALVGRAKKNWKSADLVLASLFALVANDSPGGNVVYLIANDETQAGDDLGLAKKLIELSPHFTREVLRPRRIRRSPRLPDLGSPRSPPARPHSTRCADDLDELRQCLPQAGRPVV